MAENDLVILPDSENAQSGHNASPFPSQSGMWKELHALRSALVAESGARAHIDSQDRPFMEQMRHVFPTNSVYNQTRSTLLGPLCYKLITIVNYYAETGLSCIVY